MGWSWVVLPLVLIVAEGRQAGPPAPAGSPFRIDLGAGKTTKGSWSSGCMVEMVGPRGRHVLLETIDDNLCPEGLVDEMTVAACRAAVIEFGASDVRRSPTHAASPMASEEGTAPRTTDDPAARETWRMTLREAIGIALDNSQIARVIALGATGVGGAASTGAEDAKRAYSNGKPIVIAGLDPDASSWRFRAEVMVEVRSAERQYWNLSQAHAQLWAADRAVGMAKEVLEREQAELMLGRGTRADVAEAQQRLEQLNLDLEVRTSDVITTERQLRKALGLPPADTRRIIPVTPPTEARLEPDWDTSLSEMLAHQPDVVQQRMLARLAEMGLLIARNQLLPVLSLEALHDLRCLGSKVDRPEVVSGSMVLKSLPELTTEQEMETASAGGGGTPKGFPSWRTGWAFLVPLSTGRYPLANSRQAQYILLRSRAHYRQIVHQTTHALARYFLEVDANHKQFRTAVRLRRAAAQRLDAQRAYYEEGRITVDRFLDAICQYATAVATEAQYRTTYNTSIAALEEAKGTLLAYDDIVVAEAPRSSMVVPARAAGADIARNGPIKRDPGVMTASLVEEPKDVKAPTTKAAGSSEAKDAAPPKARTWTFSFSIGGASSLQIKGTITSGEDKPAPGGR